MGRRVAPGKRRNDRLGRNPGVAHVKYVGLDPRTRVLRWSLFAVLIGIVVGGTAGQAVDTASGWLL